MDLVVDIHRLRLPQLPCGRFLACSSRTSCLFPRLNRLYIAKVNTKNPVSNATRTRSYSCFCFCW